MENVTGTTTSSIWAITGNFWLKYNLLDDRTAADVARSVLLLSQANYFAARACLLLANDYFSQLGVKSLPKRFLDQARAGHVPSWAGMTKYLPEAMNSLNTIPNQSGAIILSGLRDATLDGISHYIDCVDEVTPLRNSICHGVLTKNENDETVLHPTGGGDSFVLSNRVPAFLVLSKKAYAGSQTFHDNLLLLSTFVGRSS